VIVPGFKTTLSVIGAVYVLLAGSMLARGAVASMQPFGVPEPVLSSPHYADYFHFTFVHMTVLGISIVMLGRFVEAGRHQRLVARVLGLINLHYAYLDFRTSDSVLGNHLYRGSASLVPAIIDVIVTLAFAWLSFRPFAPAAPAAHTLTARDTRASSADHPVRAPD
jgi:hypothetical protein